MAAVFGQFFYIRDDFFYTMEKSWRSRRTRVRARTLRLASRSNDRILRPHWHDRCGHRSCAPHESAPGGGRDTRSQRARNLRQTISVSSTVFSTDTTERVACFSRGQSSTWMVRTSPTLGPLITARAPRESGSQPRRYHGVVEENARKCESERASARFFSPSNDRRDLGRATSGVTIESHRPSFFEFHVSTQLLHRPVIFCPSLDECVILTAV